MTTELPPIRHRVRAVYIALILSWVAYIVVAAARGRAALSFWSDAFPYFGAALVVLTVAPWTRVLRSIVADLVILFWATLIIMAVLILAPDGDAAAVGVALLGAIMLPADKLCRFCGILPARFVEKGIKSVDLLFL